MSATCPPWCRSDELDIDDGDDSLVRMHTAVLGVAGQLKIGIQVAGPDEPEIVLSVGRSEISFDLADLDDVITALRLARAQLR